MIDLVGSLASRNSGYKLIESIYEELRAAQSYLAAGSARALQRAADFRGNERGGIGAEPVRATPLERPCPVLIEQGLDESNLTGVVGHWTTMERRGREELERFVGASIFFFGKVSGAVAQPLAGRSR